MELFASGERNMVTRNPPIDWTFTVNCMRVNYAHAISTSIPFYNEGDQLDIWVC